MINHYNIKTVDGQIYRFYTDDISYYDFNKDKSIKLVFNDGSFIEFYKRNVVYIEAISIKTGESK